MAAHPLKHLTVGGHRVELNRRLIEGKRGALAEPILKHAVSVNASWYPVKQAIEVVASIHRADVISTEARRVFRTLGFEVKL